MNKIIGATIGTALIAGTLIWGYLEYNNTEYVCDKCHTQYKPTKWQWGSALHFPNHRKMVCPHCGNWGWHKRVRVPDDRDFI